MGKLQALFGIKKAQPAQTPMETKGSRSPSIVARLMGLERLPEPTPQAVKSSGNKVSGGNRVQPASDSPVFGKQQLDGVTSKPKSKSFDDAAGKLSSLKLVNSPDQPNNNRVLRHNREPSPQEAERLQSMQLEEVNRQLLSKHMQVVEELSAAKAQLTPRQGRSLTDSSELLDAVDLLHANRHQLTPRQSRSLTDSSELLDAVDLLHANKHLFERYLQSSPGSLEKVSTKGDAVRKQETQMKTAGRIPQYLNGQSSPRPPPLRSPEVEKHRHGETDSTIVVLKPKGSRNEHHSKELVVRKEHHSKGEKPALAKVIAKKIKDRITKEVAKAFYSDVDSVAAAPQKGSPRRRSLIGGKKQSSVSVDAGKQRPEPLPQAAKPSHRSTKQKGSDEAFKMNNSKNSPVRKTQPALLEKQVVNNKRPGSHITSPPRATSVRTLGRTSRESRNDTESTNATVHHVDDDLSSEVTSGNTKVRSDVIGDLNKSSPLSVLDLLDEDVDDFIVELVGFAAARTSKSQQLQLSPGSPAKEVIQEQLICPQGREEDLSYLKKLVAASTENGSFHPLDPSLFESLEEEYNMETSSTDELDDGREQAHVSALNRWLIFDLFSDTLSNLSWKQMTSFKTSKQLLKEQWSSICELYRLQSPDQSMQALVGFEFREDHNNQEDVSDICQQIEYAIFNDLVEEAVSELV